MYESLLQWQCSCYCVFVAMHVEETRHTCCRIYVLHAQWARMQVCHECRMLGRTALPDVFCCMISTNEGLFFIAFGSLLATCSVKHMCASMVLEASAERICTSSDRDLRLSFLRRVPNWPSGPMKTFHLIPHYFDQGHIWLGAENFFSAFTESFCCSNEGSCQVKALVCQQLDYCYRDALQCM